MVVWVFAGGGESEIRGHDAGSPYRKISQANFATGRESEMSTFSCVPHPTIADTISR